jgi:hypothetical protein
LSLLVLAHIDGIFAPPAKRFDANQIDNGAAVIVECGLAAKVHRIASCKLLLRIERFATLLRARNWQRTIPNFWVRPWAANRCVTGGDRLSV